MLLLGRGPSELQRALIALNARIRAESTGPRGAMLFVYYSGHADARALHLGHEELELSLLQRLVQGSAAGFRLLLLDACRSGALTRVKGARPAQPFEIRLAHGPFLGYALRSPLWDGAAYCQGARAGYGVDLPVLSLAASLGACRSSFSNPTLEATADELSFDVSLRRVQDLPWASLGVGLSAGGAWLRQSFDTPGKAPTRNSAAGQLGVLASASTDLPQGFYVLLEIAGQLYVFEQQAEGANRSAGSSSDLTAVFGWRPLLALGKHF